MRGATSADTHGGAQPGERRALAPLFVLLLILIPAGIVGCEGRHLWVPTQATYDPTAPSSNCVNINRASLEELPRIIHIDQVRAHDLISKRPFSSVQDLTRVSGIGSERIQDILAQGLACAK